MMSALPSHDDHATGPPPPPPRLRRYLAWGVVIGGVVGVVEALVTSIGAADFWATVHLHYFQFGCGCWGLGLLGGYIVAKRVQWARAKRWRERTSLMQCATCGYDLHGNESGRCPECGTLTQASADAPADRSGT